MNPDIFVPPLRKTPAGAMIFTHITSSGRVDPRLCQLLFELAQFGLSDFVGIVDEVNGLVHHVVAAQGRGGSGQLQAYLGSWVQLGGRPV